MSERHEYTLVTGGNSTNDDNTQEKEEEAEEEENVINGNVAKNPISDFKMTNVEDGRGSKRTLYVAACIANLASFICGTALGWTSPVLQKLGDNSTTTLSTPLQVDEESWIGSLLPVGATFGPLAIGFIADIIGRKKTILLTIALFIASFVCFIFATGVYLLYFGRFICGIGTGGLFTVLPMYIGEISEDSVRGALGSIMQLFITLGLLFAYAIGPYVSVTVFNSLCLIAPTLFVVLFTFYTPESPYYLVAVNKNRDAENSLRKLRCTENVAKELEMIEMNVAESKASKGSLKEMLFSNTAMMKALLLSIGLVSFQQFSGINAIIFYTQGIFDATGSSIPSDVSTIFIGLVQVIFSVVAPLMVDKKGKRFLLLTSSAGMAVSQFVLGYYFWRLDSHLAVDAIFWLPILCLVAYNATYCVGFGPLPWAVMGELFPSNVKSIASSLTASFCWFLAFVITKYFKTLIVYIGQAGPFYVFGACCVVSGVFVYFLLPETSGKSLQEIQEILDGKKKKKIEAELA